MIIDTFHGHSSTLQASITPLSCTTSLRSLSAITTFSEIQISQKKKKKVKTHSEVNQPLKIEALFGLSYFHYTSLNFHNSSLIFRGTHTSCSCLVWFLFSIFITHDSKNWIRVMENENKFLVFLDSQGWVTMTIS